MADRTAFYPEGGGQPWDTGTLGDAKVLELIYLPEVPVGGLLQRGKLFFIQGAVKVDGDHLRPQVEAHVLTARAKRSERDESYL